MNGERDGNAEWSSDRVETRLIAAFRALPMHPVFSRRDSVASAAGGASEHAEALSWATRFVTSRDDALMLLTWARCRAMGDSCRDRYKAMGWSRASAERARQRALNEIVACL